MKAETILAADGAKLSSRVYEPDSPDRGGDLADLGVRRLGHFGPFRSEHEAKLWPRVAQWLGALAAVRTA